MVLRLALTGASGFVGRATLPLLLQAGHQVKALARDPSKIAAAGGLKVIKGDLSDGAALGELTRDVDVVLHVAGAVSASSRAGFFAANLAGTRAVSAAAKSNGVKRFVFVSSLAAREVTLNDYGASKAAAENALKSFEQDMQITVVRPSAVYGPGDTATLPLMQMLMSKTAFIPGAPSARFSMVHVDDVAKALADSVVNAPGGVFELDDGDGGHGWPELIALTQKEFGMPQRHFYVPRAVAMLVGAGGSLWGRLTNKVSMVHTGQMRQLYHLDWVTRGSNWPLYRRMGLREGLPATIRWYQAHGMLPETLSADTRRAENGP
jgi:nucleoside-diphosphate-sugar epimerase